MKSLTAILALTLAASACSTTQQPQPEAWVYNTKDIVVIKCADSAIGDKEGAREFAQAVALNEFEMYAHRNKPKICYHENPDGTQCVRLTLQEQDCYR